MKTKDINICPDRTHNRARLIDSFKTVYDNGDIVEMKAWKVENSAQYPEGVRYSLVFIHNGERLLGYDNYEGKGHHKHIEGKEVKIEFISVEELKRQFENECEKLSKKISGEEYD